MRNFLSTSNSGREEFWWKEETKLREILGHLEVYSGRQSEMDDDMIRNLVDDTQIFKENGNGIEIGSMGTTSTHQTKLNGSRDNVHVCLLAMQKNHC